MAQLDSVERMEIIKALKKKFPITNPASWSRNSNKQLIAWYNEFIKGEK